MKKTFNNTKLRESSVKSSYIKALENIEFKKLVNSLKIDEKEIIFNTTKLEETLEELKNCKNCNGLHECKNKELGFINYPKNYNGNLIFSYVACKYQKEFNKKKLISEENIIENASMKDIDVTDKNRVKLIKWVDNFINKYHVAKKNK